jgi:exopolyphosphatase/guanosine-5'-triphosphate,3'-diphosphate pyrophosphatase
MERTVAALKEYTIQLKSHQVEQVKLVATAAVREAVNRDELVERVFVETGLQVKVITGEEEARLSYLGVVKGLGQISSKAMVIDVGGGSTEFIWQAEAGSLNLVSIPVGAVRATEGKWAQQDYFNRLSPTLATIAADGPEVAIGVGGTATTLAAMEIGNLVYDPDKVHGSKISSSRVSDWHEKLAAMSAEELTGVPGLMPQRADIIVAGTKIIQTILKGLGLEQMVISETDLLWGLIFDS